MGAGVESEWFHSGDRPGGHVDEGGDALIAGLLPIMWSHGAGADVMKRIAAPMIGGMVTSTILTLAVIPAIYALWRSRGKKLN